MLPDYQQIIQQLNEAKRRLDLMRTVGLELNNVSSLSDKLKNILFLLHEQFYINYSMMLLPDVSATKLVVHCSYGYEQEKAGLEIPMGKGIVGLAAQKKIPINITGLERKRKYVFTSTSVTVQPSDYLPGLAEPESQFAIPLVANDELVAVLLAESYNVCVFSKEDESFLITLSQSIAVSIQNSRLFDIMENLIVKRTEDLHKSNETKNRLFSLISHDLRGPITSFHNIAKLVSFYNRQNEKEKIDLLSQRIDQSVDKLNTLLDNLLNWALSQTNELQCMPQSLSLTALLNEVIAIFDDQILLKQITVSTEFVHNLQVCADYNMLAAVFRNLLSNALKYTPRGKIISVRTAIDEGRVLVEIKDNGVGIPADKLHSIFEPNDRKSTPGTDREKGTGLGLMVAREFIRLNGGTISMESSLDTGTTVKVHLTAS